MCSSDLITRQLVFARQPIVLPPGGGCERVVMNLAGELASVDRRDGGRFGVVRQAAGINGPVVVLAQDDRHRRALSNIQRSADRAQVRVVIPAELAELPDIGILVRTDRRPHRPPLSSAVQVEQQVARSPLLIIDSFGPDSERLAHRRVRPSKTGEHLAEFVGPAAHEKIDRLAARPDTVVRRLLF